MRLTRWAVFASLWLLAVGVVGTATWYAIDSAGRSTQVLASSDAPGGVTPDSGAPRGATPAAEPTSAAAPTSASQQPSDDPPTTGATTSSSSSSKSSASAGSSTKPSSARPQTSSSSRPSSRTTSSSSSSSSSSPDAQSKLVKTPGGSVTITCRDGEQIDFTVRPAQGWGGDANQQGPQEADIKFSSGREVWEVHARCLAGAPDWTVEHKQHDD